MYSYATVVYDSHTHGLLLDVGDKEGDLDEHQKGVYRVDERESSIKASIPLSSTLVLNITYKYTSTTPLWMYSPSILDVPMEQLRYYLDKGDVTEKPWREIVDRYMSEYKYRLYLERVEE